MRKPQVVVVTGASAGVGRATARRFAERGACVALLARGRDRLDAAVREIGSAGGRSMAVSVDVADPDAVTAAAREVEARLGPVDTWVNNAMTSVFAPFVEVSAAEFRRVTEVTYLGCVHGTRAALDLMLPRDRGVIVQVGSALAYRGIPLQAAYCGAKHAIQGFTESVRCELLHRHSHVQLGMVQLPALNTPQFGWVLSRLPKFPQPVAPIYQPEVAARAIVHMAEHPRREMWVGGSTVATLLANSVVPGLLDSYLGRTAVKGQQTDDPVPCVRPANLWEPVGGDPGARGVFDDRARAHSLALAMSRRRRPLTAGVVGALAAAAVARGRSGS